MKFKICKPTRITPAHAGKTPLGCAFAPPKTDHPRACGENMCLTCRQLAGNGSPPRMRGKLITAIRDYLRTRITPAHAGKTMI